MIQAVIFDCFGVLYHGSLTHMLELTPPESRQKLLDINHAFDRGFVTRDEFIKEASELTGLHQSEVKRVMNADHIRNQALLDYVLEIKKNYRTALLSNIGQHVIDRLFQPEELERYFDAVVLSSAVGMVKPYPEIYAYTASRLHVAPNECIMIDDLYENIDGAKAVGMQGIVYHTKPQLMVDLGRLLTK